jgi:Holliday junction resolvasome RuvABC endonuclease subunit
MPSNSSSIAILVGIDPGSTMLGIGVMRINVETMQIVSTEAWSINAAKLAGKESWAEQLYDFRTARISAIEEYLLNLFNRLRPLSINSEAPFVNQKFPQAGIALTEVVSAIRSAVNRYSFWHVLEMTPPSSVKNAVGVHGAGAKDAMRNKLIEMKDEIAYDGHIPIEELDEHSIDALAVVYCRYRFYI